MQCRQHVRLFHNVVRISTLAKLQAAQLLPDFAILPGGDSTEIGSRGINVSGGQKARIALARALFGTSDVVFLDDVLSAVDVHVATAIINEAILGVLKQSTRIIVANTFLPLLLPHAQSVVVLGPGGAVDTIAPPEEALASSKWLREAVGTMGSCAEAQTAAKPAALPSANSEAPVLSASGKQDGSLLIAEDRQVGILSLHAYASYFRQATSSGSLLQGAVLFVFVTLLVVLAEVCRTSTEIWVTLWTEATGDSGQDLPYWLGGYSAILILLILVCLLRAVVFLGIHLGLPLRDST